MSPKLMFSLDTSEPPPEPMAPEGGWHKPDCTFESHSWVLEVEDGRFQVICADPCDAALFDPSEPTPRCLHDWEPEDFHTPEPLPVQLVYVDDSTPSTPAGPAEYDFYIEVRPA